MKKVLSEYYGIGNGRTAKVLIETMGDDKKFYVDYSESAEDESFSSMLEKLTEQDAEDCAEDYVLKNKSISE